MPKGEVAPWRADIPANREVFEAHVGLPLARPASEKVHSDVGRYCTPRACAGWQAQGHFDRVPGLTLQEFKGALELGEDGHWYPKGGTIDPSDLARARKKGGRRLGGAGVPSAERKKN